MVDTAAAAFIASAPAEGQLHSETDSHAPGKMMPLTIGAIGVVFGDIGTSPLYAFREALGQAASDGLYREEILGVMSLMLWALILIVTVKYVILLMRADNEGEGGVLALLALARRGASSGRSASSPGSARSARRCSMATRSSRPRFRCSRRSRA